MKNWQPNKGSHSVIRNFVAGIHLQFLDRQPASDICHVDGGCQYLMPTSRLPSQLQAQSTNKNCTAQQS